MSKSQSLSSIPSVDKLLAHEDIQWCLESAGHQQTTLAIRQVLTTIRETAKSNDAYQIPEVEKIIETVAENVAASSTSSLTPVINMTGTILHTNLGRANLPETALAAVNQVARGGSNLEYELASGVRGDRDSHVEALLAELTGAEAVTVVNNNAAAVLICLNTFAFGKGVCISRGELVEIGGSFRIPEVMEKSGCNLVEVGATNRTHLKDYQNAINENLGLLLKVHTSNYEIQGFTKEVSYQALSDLAQEHDLPFMADLGSGTLVNLEEFGLDHEPTVQDVLNAGTDIVTFSGDKLLGGPQAGIIAGSKVLIDAVKNNPLKRALRVDKMTMAALAEVLKLYRHPEALTETLPTLRHLSRNESSVQQIANTLQPAFAAALNNLATVTVVKCASQIGSGALPLNQIPSAAIRVQPINTSNTHLQQLSLAFRQLPIPIVGRIQDGSLMFDARTVDEPALVIEQLQHLNP